LTCVALASAFASWVAFGWDLSEVDAEYRKIDRTMAAWRLPVGILVVVTTVVVAAWLFPRAWSWIAATATIAIEVWFTWRGYAGRSNGANMTGVGTVFLLPPIVGLTFVPAWVSARFAHRRTTR
jgi:hypothetical protein